MLDTLITRDLATLKIMITEFLATTFSDLDHVRHECLDRPILSLKVLYELGDTYLCERALPVAVCIFNFYVPLSHVLAQIIYA